jgi:hypothetical protein
METRGRLRYNANKMKSGWRLALFTERIALGLILKVSRIFSIAVSEHDTDSGLGTAKSQTSTHVHAGDRRSELASRCNAEEGGRQ